ncbi:uncharacterized protein H6S33_012295 [Morchella sextelata]|uniref:uncharacterized protein n=1 Tax=Morchella sextelata TaxID=1174677 RepID=UPI001D036C0C|nr:uncharacterized protein H6S33_012295 [Morchella sextelata]KAH0609749.1 hypothetical protein H6S33_012295 [Morchella sextelata]
MLANVIVNVRRKTSQNCVNFEDDRCATFGLLKERFRFVRINWSVFSSSSHHTFVYGVTELERERTDSKFKANSKEGIAL